MGIFEFEKEKNAPLIWIMNKSNWHSRCQFDLKMYIWEKF